MMKVVVRRVLVMPFLLLGIVTATFILAQFTKGNPLVSIIGARSLSNPEIVAAAKTRWGWTARCPNDTPFTSGISPTAILGRRFGRNSPFSRTLRNGCPRRSSS